MTYQLKLDIFEGPLDLLLHLIREQKMDVYDIPVAEVARQYSSYLDLMQDLNLEIAGEFLVMAAELTRIKSKVLLPAQDGEGDGEDGQDPRAELTRRLLEYQRYKEAAGNLRRMEFDRQQLFGRGSEIQVEEGEEEIVMDATVFDLFSAFKEVLSRKAFQKDYEIKITALSVSERLRRVLDHLNEVESITFEALFSDSNSKLEVIVTFLALLELMRMSLVRVQQGTQFETIRVYRTSDRETQEEALKVYQESEQAPELNSENI
ncbi:MAG: segregation/condensation protein A [Nitrospinaceae bacterium]|nr:segregation/condensation protein A [Nitrospinaceae bacterium]NIR57372.1 segregation/condensation protein A [Nitrospinaceae bacterium]NIS87824.1 segregation/condensation protein A [Nitrospinaceae bacterium]NIT84694.1 segregation/condensation protein A [Nitrospinaceae bacterium]NIU46873.1 segregation/condensation protein A [Nitrospinaceae bacterium]